MSRGNCKGTIEMMTFRTGGSSDKYITGTTRIVDNRNKGHEDYGVMSVIVTREARKKLANVKAKKVKLYVAEVQAIVGLNGTVGVMVTDFGTHQEVK